MSEKDPVISIIVPVYKVEAYLHQCVDSILAQTFKAFELVLVDDGSPDRCPEICDQYAAKDSRIHVIHKSNGGLTSAWKAGVSVCRGRYIGFVDSDDWIEGDMYEQMYKAIKTHDADVVQCDFVKGPSNPALGRCMIDKTYVFDEVATVESLVPRMLVYWEFEDLIFSNSRWNKLIRRELVTANMGYCDDSIRLGEDLNLMLPVLLDCRKVVCIPGCYYHYRLSPGSITRKPYKQDYWMQCLMLMKRVDDVAGQKGRDIADSSRKLFNYMALAAMENELASPDGMIGKLTNIRRIMGQNPARHYMHMLKSGRLGRNYRLLYLLCRICMV